MQSTKFRKWKGAITACSPWRERAEFSRTAGGPYLLACLHFSAHQVFPRLPLPDQRELIAANQRFCR